MRTSKRNLEGPGAADQSGLEPPGGWIDTSSPHIAPLAPAEMGRPLRLLLSLVQRVGRRISVNEAIPDLFMVLLRHGRLFWPWLFFASRLMPNGTLPRLDTELLILRVAWNCRCRYEWGQHAGIGAMHGLDPVQIAQVGLGADGPCWDNRQQALLQAADELHQGRQIRSETWSRLSGFFTSTQIVEIAMLVGHYEMLAGVVNSIGIPLEVPVEDALNRMDLPARLEAVRGVGAEVELPHLRCSRCGGGSDAILVS